MSWFEGSGFCSLCLPSLFTPYYYSDSLDLLPHFSRFVSFPLTYDCLKAWKKNQGFLLNQIILEQWKMMLFAIREKINPNQSILIPMPHQSALKKCTSLLAEEASKVFNIPTLQVLSRGVDWKKQATQNQFERMKKESIFFLKNDLAGSKNVYLIDDFCTTRNTLLGAKKILESCGANVQGYLTLSTTPSRSLNDLQTRLVPLPDLSFLSKKKSAPGKRF